LSGSFLVTSSVFLNSLIFLIVTIERITRPEQ
jgi:hypothetical protein